MTKLCVCVKLWYVTCVEVEAGGGAGEGGDPGYRIKNKNPTHKVVGKKKSLVKIIFFYHGACFWKGK